MVVAVAVAPITQPPHRIANLDQVCRVSLALAVVTEHVALAGHVLRGRWWFWRRRRRSTRPCLLAGTGVSYDGIYNKKSTDINSMSWWESRDDVSPRQED